MAEEKTSTIDSTTAGIYIHEIRNQCAYVQASLEMFNQAMEKDATIAILYSAQNMLQHSSTLARTLFPVRKAGAKNEQAMREMLGIDTGHPLNDKPLLRVCNDPEERMIEWIDNSRDRFVVMDYVGPFGVVGDQPVEGMKQSDVFRHIDPATLNFIFRGDSFALQGIANAVADIDARIKQLHDQMFPDAKESTGTMDGRNADGVKESEASELEAGD